ncbi:N-formylglutamate amidohydrolase [Desulfosalsimonas propionicica]|uniref:N-formylglutamate amidohydrolase n=1 Tax=Desulfosalsimonas propionicica TaxID=332175 RepID=A0A7W0CBV9_9BACT|nr:N-formylglutamate amidohydrolase [Desulfosalsimonas propionicica]MBA2882907.1 N-formylglutamate amidohydrolase [Desulfosalsimonas propionicica]
MANSIIITIPHCSARVPGEIREQMALSDAEIQDAEDFGTAEIFGAMPVKTILPAEWSRLVADLNRAPDSRGPKGIVAETDYRGRPVYRPGRYPDAVAVEERIRQYYNPWHEKLARAISDPDVKCLFDCHSLNGTAPADAPDAGEKRKDIIISNNGDTRGRPRPGRGPVSCPAETMDQIRSALEAAGFSVAVNNPYQGGYITVHYGKQLMARGGFAVQIEMNQDLYMPPGALSPNPIKLTEITKKIEKTVTSDRWTR